MLKYFFMYDTIQTKETVILIAVDPDDREDYSFSTEDSLSELAQLSYRMTRLTGKGISMSRLGGGVELSALVSPALAGVILE